MKARNEERAPKVNIGALASFGVVAGVALVFVLLAGQPYKKCCKRTASKTNTPIIKYNRKSETVDISKRETKPAPSVRPKIQTTQPSEPIKPATLTIQAEIHNESKNTILKNTDKRTNKHTQRHTNTQTDKTETEITLDLIQKDKEATDRLVALLERQKDKEDKEQGKVTNQQQSATKSFRAKVTEFATFLGKTTKTEENIQLKVFSDKTRNKGDTTITLKDK